MGLLSKGWTLGLVGLGVVSFGQFPEFAQQYRQHLEGGLGELREVIARFDEDADGVQKNREDALKSLENSVEELPKKRGKSMRVVVARYENLVEQKQAIEEASPILRPVHVLQYPDQKILRGTWGIFEPALPLTIAGLIWSGLGGLIGWGLARVPVSAWQSRKERRSDPSYWSGQSDKL